MTEHVKITANPPVPVALTVGATPQAVFDFAFPFWAASDVLVYVGGSALPTSAYTVTGFQTQNGAPITGAFGSGRVTLNAPVANTTVLIDRLVTNDRATDFSPSAPLPPNALNSDLDRLTARTQDLERWARRGLSAPAGETGGELPALAARSGRYLGFDAQGRPAAMGAPSPEPLTAFGRGLATAGDAAAALAQLGAFGAVETAALALGRKGAAILNDGAVDAAKLRSPPEQARTFGLLFVEPLAFDCLLYPWTDVASGTTRLTEAAIRAWVRGARAAGFTGLVWTYPESRGCWNTVPAFARYVDEDTGGAFTAWQNDRHPGNQYPRDLMAVVADECRRLRLEFYVGTGRGGQYTLLDDLTALSLRAASPYTGYTLSGSNTVNAVLVATSTGGLGFTSADVGARFHYGAGEAVVLGPADGQPAPTVTTARLRVVTPFPDLTPARANVTFRRHGRTAAENAAYVGRLNRATIADAIARLGDAVTGIYVGTEINSFPAIKPLSDALRASDAYVVASVPYPAPPLDAHGLPVVWAPSFLIDLPASAAAQSVWDAYRLAAGDVLGDTFLCQIPTGAGYDAATLTNTFNAETTLAWAPDYCARLRRLETELWQANQPRRLGLTVEAWTMAGPSYDNPRPAAVAAPPEQSVPWRVVNAARQLLDQFALYAGPAFLAGLDLPQRLPQSFAGIADYATRADAQQAAIRTLHRTRGGRARRARRPTWRFRYYALNPSGVTFQGAAPTPWSALASLRPEFEHTRCLVLAWLHLNRQSAHASPVTTLDVTARLLINDAVIGPTALVGGPDARGLFGEGVLLWADHDANGAPFSVKLQALTDPALPAVNLQNAFLAVIETDWRPL